MTNDKRRDPYRNFNFLTVVGGAIGAVALLGIFRRLLARVKVLPPGVYVEEIPAGPRPIEGVGTSTASRSGRSRKPRARTSRQASNARRKR